MLMKFIKFILVLVYLFVYVYSVRMTETRPDETRWGWICALIFLIFSIWAMREFMDKETKNRQD
jgi:hypothetical protein